MSLSSLCVKCKKEPACIDIKFALYCSPCFLEATYHKYRTLIGKCRESMNSNSSSANKSLILLPRNFLESPVLARACRVLIHFSQLAGIQEPARKNLIDYELAVPVSIENGMEEFMKIKEFIEMIRLEYPLLVRIHLIYIESDIIIPYDSSLSFDQAQRINFDISGLSSTLKEDLFNMKLLHNQLKLMKSLSIDKAIIPDTSTFLASYILTCTCKGRGKFLSWDSGSIRSFPNDLVIIRPLKEISDKEIELYCKEINYENLSIQTRKEVSSSLSIDQLTTNFLSNLESENPGTANVVIRTSSKVTTAKTLNESNGVCPICFAPNENICESCNPLKNYF